MGTSEGIELGERLDALSGSTKGFDLHRVLRATPIEGLFMWLRPGGMGPIRHVVVVVETELFLSWILEDCYGISTSEADMDMDSSTPVQYRRISGLIRRWREVLSMPSTDSWPYTMILSNRGSICNSDDREDPFPISIVVRDVDKELLKFQKRRATISQAPLAAAIDDVIAYLSYSLRVSIVQLKIKNSGALSEYLFSFSQCVLKKHNALLSNDSDGDFMLSRR